MIELAQQFVPTTDEVWRLQNGKDPECQFFQQISRHGHYGPNNSSQQGIYVCAPSGKLLASINSNNPDRVIATLKRGLNQWDSLGPDQRKLKNRALVQPHRRMESAQPENGLILEMYARDIPEDHNPSSPRATKWNRDTAWFSKAEATHFIADKPVVGQTYPLPAQLVNRLVAMHMVDMVNGQTEPFRTQEVRESMITAQIMDIDKSLIKIEFSGDTKSDSGQTGHNKSPRGVVTNLRGQATYNMGSQQFTQFELVAVGRRWGYTRFNDRRNESRNSNSLGFVFRLVDPDQPPNVPAFIWAYQAPWKKENLK